MARQNRGWDVPGVFVSDVKVIVPDAPYKPKYAPFQHGKPRAFVVKPSAGAVL